MIKNALIESANIETVDGFFTVMLSIRVDDGIQGFGGWVLYSSDDILNSGAGHFISRVMHVAGVKRWSQVPGRYIRVKKGAINSPIDEIGHIVEDDWFNPKADFDRAGRE